jgi:hypothetical protein
MSDEAAVVPVPVPVDPARLAVIEEEIERLSLVLAEIEAEIAAQRGRHVGR